MRGKINGRGKTSSNQMLLSADKVITRKWFFIKDENGTLPPVYSISSRDSTVASVKKLTKWRAVF